MKTLPHKTERLHALDSLRAIMMMLGIVLHSGVTYLGGEASQGWPLRDPLASSSFIYWLIAIIHNFRMPIFMVVAGFFAALLFFDRSPKKMIINRCKRIVYPFIVFVILLWPLVTLAFSYSNKVFSFDKVFETVIGTMYINTTPSTFSELIAFIPQTTMHLWFLYYLIIFSFASLLLGLLFKKAPFVTAKTTAFYNVVLQKPILKLIVFSILTFLVLRFMDKSWVDTSTSFVPDFGTFLFYFYFYMFGWILFKSKHLLNTFMSYDWAFTLIGILIYTVYFIMDTTTVSIEIKTLINATCVSLFIFGFIGLFLRYFSNHSPRMRYISDSSYWVYLLHLPLTALLPGLIGEWNLPAVVKFLIVVVITTIICFVTYHYFVRSTFIGKFLNGRKYSKNLSDIRKAEASSKLKPIAIKI